MSAPSLRGAPAPVGLYVHVPFCVHRCHYCDFSVARTDEAPVDEWLAAIRADLASWFDHADWKRGTALETVFVGGGTPSLLGSPGMVALARLLREYFDVDAVTEWTAEANPSSLSAEVCEGWLDTGVNRLSIGVQSFSDEVLRWLGRLHDADGAEEALGTARSSGFTNVNADLIFGLPEQIERDWSAEVGHAARLGVTHVSVYGLTAEPRTPLGRRVGLGHVHMPPDDRCATEYLEAAATLEAAAYVHYEVSNFALEGQQSLHNWHYWDGSPYLGVGPSAHSFLPPHRLWNAYRWDTYRAAARAGSSVREGYEALGPEQERMERVWLGLRTNVGLPADELAGDAAPMGGAFLAACEAEGWIERDGGRIRLTAQGWLRMDALVGELEHECRAG